MLIWWSKVQAHEGEKGTCKIVSTPTVKLIFEYNENVKEIG
jgi:hypothetical protein